MKENQTKNLIIEIIIKKVPLFQFSGYLPPFSNIDNDFLSITIFWTQQPRKNTEITALKKCSKNFLKLKKILSIILDIVTGKC